MKKNRLYSVCKIIYTFLVKIIYRPQVTGKENIPTSGSLIFAGNHIHAVDPVIVMSNTDRIVHYMAKEELFRGIHGVIFEKIGLIKVYRGRSNQSAVIEAQEILKNNGTIGIFPEGTRNRTDKELLKFRPGAVAIAKKTNTKIVPFAIKGQYRLFRKGVRIEFGKPLDFEDMDVENANIYLKDEVLKLLRR